MYKYVVAPEVRLDVLGRVPSWVLASRRETCVKSGLFVRRPRLVLLGSLDRLLCSGDKLFAADDCQDGELNNLFHKNVRVTKLFLRYGD
jgi:hypothetical protein